MNLGHINDTAAGGLKNVNGNQWMLNQSYDAKLQLQNNHKLKNIY